MKLLPFDKSRKSSSTSRKPDVRKGKCLGSFSPIAESREIVSIHNIRQVLQLDQVLASVGR